MFDNENKDQMTNNQTTGSSEGAGSANSYNNQGNGGTGYSNYSGADNNRAGSNGSYSGNGYNSAGNYGNGSAGNYSGNTTGYGNPANGGYGQGSYSGYNTNPGAGQNGGSYGSGNYNGGYTGTSYSTYQYGNYQQAGGGAQPPKKGGAGKKVAAGIAVALVLALGLGAGYYSMTRINGNSSANIEKSDDQALLEDNEDSVAKANDSTQEESSAEAAESTEEQASSSDSTDAGISKTQTGDEATAVVTDVTDVVSAAMPSIVSINNNYTESASYFGQTYTEELTASGSGIIVGTNDSELLIVTNYHVVEGADSLEVQFVDTTTAAAEVKGTDSDMDLAVIAVQLTDLSTDTRNNIAIASLGDSDSLVVGEPAIAIGNALGYGQSVTTGVISAVNRAIELSDTSGDTATGTFIQTDAAINPGNSGGALLNINGEVVGINSSKIGGSTIEGMGYAIPISVAKPIIEQLMTEKTRAKVSEEERGYIGISGVSVTSEVSEMYGLPTGVYVAAVTDGGGAQAAGLQEGDIITEFDGKEISSMDDLQNRLAYYSAGETVNITVMRQATGGYDSQEFTITLGNSSTIQTTDDSNSNDTYDGAQQQEDALPEENQNGQQDNGEMPSDGFGNGNNGFGFGFNFGN